MQKLKDIYTGRIDKYLSPTYFSDVNLWSRRIKSKSAGNKKLKVYHVPYDMDSGKPPINKIISLVDAVFEECNVGIKIGPSWTTHWFKLALAIPEELAGKKVWLKWELGCESLLYDNAGTPLVGFSDNRCEYLLSEEALPGKTYNFLIEASANGLFGNGNGGTINAPDPGRHYELKSVDLVVYNEQTLSLMTDLRIIKDMIKFLGVDQNPRGAEALATANLVINTINNPQYSLIEDEDVSVALGITRKFLSQKNGSTAHTVYAVGHCHIDTAWLWDYSETRRKAARSWASQVEFMQQRSYPDFKFVCSQMQQYEWLKQDYPKLFEKIKSHINTGQFIPIGGSWVEMDANIPSGESFIRQFLYGQKFVKDNFGFYNEIFWLPGLHYKLIFRYLWVLGAITSTHAALWT
jgi:alpha-mannosidase